MPGNAVRLGWVGWLFMLERGRPVGEALGPSPQGRVRCARVRRFSAMRSSSITLDGDVYDEVAIDRQLEHAEAQLLQLRVAKAELINRRRRRSELTEGTERSFVQLSSVETSEAQGAQVPAGFSGATRGGLLTRHFRHACATAWTHCATSAASSFLGGVLDGVPYPCSPGARSYCDGEVELEHEIEAEAEVGAVGGATGLPRRYPPQDTCAPPLIATPPSHCHALPLPPLSLSMCAEDADVALGSHSASYTLAERDLPLSPYSPLPSAFPPGMRRSSSDATGVGVQSVCMNGLALALEAKQFLALTIACCVVSVRF